MTGKFNEHIVQVFRTQFEKQCVQLLLESHLSLLKEREDFSEADENAVTVRLIGLMKRNPVSSNYKIDINREHYLDGDDVYSGVAHPNKSPRIDIRMMTWTSPVKFEYFFEAKNLYERDFKKSGNSSVSSSKALQQRYVSTGIQHFISGKYSRGCLVAYVLNGRSKQIVEAINALLIEENRNEECLMQHATFEKSQQCFISNYPLGKSQTLLHYFLSFEHNN